MVGAQRILTILEQSLVHSYAIPGTEGPVQVRDGDTGFEGLWMVGAQNTLPTAKDFIESVVRLLYAASVEPLNVTCRESRIVEGAGVEWIDESSCKVMIYGERLGMVEAQERMAILQELLEHGARLIVATDGAERGGEIAASQQRVRVVMAKDPLLGNDERSVHLYCRVGVAEVRQGVCKVVAGRQRVRVVTAEQLLPIGEKCLVGSECVVIEAQSLQGVGQIAAEQEQVDLLEGRRDFAASKRWLDDAPGFLEAIEAQKRDGKLVSSR
jgi:hypothetical protein